MTSTNGNTPPAERSQAEFQELLNKKMRAAVRLILVTILAEEAEALVGARRYVRSPQRRGQRNGYYTRDLRTTVGAIEDLPVPRTRQGFRGQLSGLHDHLALHPERKRGMCSMGPQRKLLSLLLGW